MPRMTINDPRLENSRNLVISDLRSAGWLYKKDDPEVDPNGLAMDVIRGGTANGAKFSKSPSGVDFANKQEELFRQLRLDQEQAGSDENIRRINAQASIVIEEDMKKEYVTQFLIETLIPDQEPDEKIIGDINKAFDFYVQDLQGFVKAAISSEVFAEPSQIKSPLGSAYYPSTNDLKTIVDWRMNGNGELYLYVNWQLILTDMQSNDASQSKVNVPGSVSWEFLLTPEGFKLQYIDFSNSLLQDLCLGSEKEIDLQPRLRQASFEEAGIVSEEADIGLEEDVDDNDIAAQDEPAGMINILRNVVDAVYTQLISAYTMVYPPDGFDPVTKTLNGEKIRYSHQASRFYFHPLTLITSFLGLPNGNPVIHEDLDEDASVQSIGNLFWRFLSWDDTQAIGVNIVRAPIATAFHLLMIIPKLVVNLAKLVTEFLPELGSQIFGKISRTANKKLNENLKSEEGSYPRIIGWGALYGAAKIAETIFKMMNFVGRAITSPIANMRSAWHGGDQLGKWLANQLGAGKKTKKFIRASIATIFGSLTGAFTIAIYVIAAPIGAKFALGTILPHVPGFIAVAVKAVIPVISTVASVTGSFVMPVMGPLMGALGVTFSPLALLATAVFTSVVGNEAAKSLKAVTGRAVERVSSWFRKPAGSNEGREERAMPDDSKPVSRPRRSSSVSESSRSRSNSDWRDSQASSPRLAGMFAHNDDNPPAQAPDLTKEKPDKSKPDRP